MRNLVRQGDTMIAVERSCATVKYSDILDCAEVVYDEHSYETPWDNCGGFEHTTRRATFADRDREQRGLCWDNFSHERIVIELTDKADCGLYEYMRLHGASRQVAAEAVACQRRRMLDQLTSWYENGWNWYGVVCSFSVLGKEYHDSIYGIDCEEFARREFLPEVVGVVVDELERDGFTVIGRPDKKIARQECKRESVRFGLLLGTWKN